MHLALSPCLVLALFAVDPAAARWQNQQLGSRLRSLGQDAVHLVEEAKAWSPSIRQLIERLERSDLIVYVRLDGNVTKFSGETRFMAAARGARYVMVGINPRADQRELVARLGHELRHVVEIADAPEVRDLDAVLALFRRIGWAGTTANGFETAEAIETGHRVAAEVRTGHGVTYN